jgi:hypothetical protein
MKPRKSLIALIALASVLPLAVHAQQPSDPIIGTSSDPILGTWKLNVAKSTFDPGPAPQSETRRYVLTPGGIDFTDQVVTADGNKHIVYQTYKLDGKDAVPLAPAGGPSAHLFTVDPNIGSERQTQVSRFVAKANLVYFTQGKIGIIGHRTRVESKDGKRLTFETTLTTRTGQSEHDVEVFDRQ